ncbi:MULTISPECIES: hypothetical protein [Burkholderia]|uniref:hypothetical protein n=1 Tax=Burkholderia TaxID=32008 RepID=UPI00064ECDCA|nr:MULTISPECIES: hypothetical protein [Burkholderia]KML20246.1 hypothetical protein VL00_04665 [Burkholderia cepacia]KML38259.1 hypothetical protein VL13_21770 [Burkholderia lata]KMN61911.1 hypothetical protein VK92_04850 [Burkholderia sp. LK4]MDR8025556.1 hypothetical protein [Burkholderia cenocepacia]MDR8042796.1 hypothetical protein [Burkholderia cenocepacia]
MKKTFTFEFDTDRLSTFSDDYLAGCWYTAQFLPVEHGDRDAGEVVRAVGVEIIRRWMRSQPIPMFHIQSGDYLLQQIRRFARWNGTEWVAASAVDESRATVDDQPAGRNA